MLDYVLIGVFLIILAGLLSQFRPAATQRIAENLFAVRSIMVNFYICKSGRALLVFDTGMNPVLVRLGMKKLGLAPEDVTHVFLTHTDYDHTGGLSAFPKAERFISKAEEQMINGQTARRGIIHNKPFSPYTTLEDGETVDACGAKVKIRVTPGHTAGSAIYEIDGRYLVTGDLLRVSKYRTVKPFSAFINSNHKQDIQSIEDVRSVIDGAEMILTGHTGFR